MQNINPIYLLQPAIVIALVFAAVFYSHRKRELTGKVLLYSFIAYALAIVVKIVFQQLTIGIVSGTDNLFLLGTYYGLQTMILEVGLAYVIARYAISKGLMMRRNAFGYGIGLAFWENGVLLGIFSLISLISTYVVLSSGGGAASIAYNAIEKSSPMLFSTSQQAVQPILLGVLERVSSIMLHVAWGFLVFAAAYYKKGKYLLVALLMGLVDFFVPFANIIGLMIFEILVFVIALVSLSIVVFADGKLKDKLKYRRSKV